VCGDARDRDAFKHLMGSEKARLVISDPPWNVKIGGHVSGKGKVKHREFVEASGEKTSPQFEAFLETSLGLLAVHSHNGSIHFIFTDWRHLDENLRAGRRVFREFKNLIVWAKSNAGMGSFYRSQHELVLVWKNGTAKHVNNFELGQHGRHRTNVWSYARASSFGQDRMDDLSRHPTAKPIAMIEDALRDCSNRGDIVLDCFAGSGVLAIAAERVSRRARLIELDPIYCDVIIRRWQQVTGKQAVHQPSGETFDQRVSRTKRAGAAS
jgi:hypothetical protein